MPVDQQHQKYLVSDCMSRPSHFDPHTRQSGRLALFSGEISVATGETFQPVLTIHFFRSIVDGCGITSLRSFDFVQPESIE